jgi:hypothetical protein
MTADNKPDIIVETGTGIQILPNTGSGMFGTGTIYPESVDFGPMVLGDVTGDGKLDVLIANYETQAGGFVVVPGVGTGLGTARAFLGPYQDIAVGDMNGDGKLDVIIAGHAVQTLLNPGDGSFQLYDTVPFDQGIWNFRIIDVDMDGHNDLVATSAGLDVMLNDGTGHLQPAINYAAFGQKVIAVADLTGDGRPDVVTGDQMGSNVNVFVNTGTAFAAAQPYTAGRNPADVIVSDLDGDGRRDVALVSNQDQTLIVMRGNGDGSLASPATYPTPYPVGLRAADFNGDGLRDIAVVSAMNQVTIFLNSGNGSFAASSDTYPAGSWPIRVIDIDHDGRVDIVSPQVSLLSNGDGTFRSITIDTTGQPTTGQPSAFVIRDLDGDGELDLYWNPRLLSSVASTMIMWQRGHGDGTFDPALAFLTIEAWAGDVGDLDGDGRPDIVTFYDDKSTAAILRNTCSN